MRLALGDVLEVLEFLRLIATPVPLHYYFEYETHDRAVFIGRYPRLFDRNGKKRFSADGSL